MIRRDHHGEVWLIPQAQRCALARTLAEQVGNHQFLAVSPKVLSALADIDAGWGETDSAEHAIDSTQLDRGTLLGLWEASAALAAERDAYAGLLVTLAGFWKSMAVGASELPQWDARQTRVRFDLNRFQHTMIERLEALRVRCGLRVDRPLKFGLAEGSRDPAERQLRLDFSWLQLFDTLSAALCRGQPSSASLTAWARGNSKPSELMAEVQGFRASLNPWPFRLARFEAVVAYQVESNQGSHVAPPFQTFTIDLAPFTI